MAKTTGYTFLRWNGKYGKDALFIVKDNANDMQALFAPNRKSDLAWVRTDLANADEHKAWDDFGHETVADLNEVVF
jgi:hypothetical protein|nr:MAG TPA: hypothetical protein [Herelleviridae sp.]